MAKKRQWLYKKDGRWYGNFRPYADVGGGQEALIPEGERFATKDYRVAKRLMKARRVELKRLRMGGHQAGSVDMRLLGPFVDFHMEREAKRRGADKARLSQVEQRLNVATEYFGEDRLLRSITTMHLEEYIDFLTERLRWEGTARVSSGLVWSGLRPPWPPETPYRTDRAGENRPGIGAQNVRSRPWHCRLPTKLEPDVSAAPAPRLSALACLSLGSRILPVL